MDPSLACVWGFVRVFFTEFPTVHVGLVDLSLDNVETETLSLSDLILNQVLFFPALFLAVYFCNFFAPSDL